MPKAMIKIEKLNKIKLHLLSLLFVSINFINVSNAQEPSRADMNILAAKYKNEHAIYTNYSQHLIITDEDEQLSAKIDYNIRKLFISDLSPSLYGNESLEYSYLIDLVSGPFASAYIPKLQQGYERINCRNFADNIPSDGESFYDDTRIKTVLYSGLTKRAVTETKYTTKCTEVNILPRLFIQKGIPIVKSVIEVTVPSYIQMDFVLKGEHTNWIKETRYDKNNTITFKFTAVNVPPYKSFKGVPSGLYNLPHVIAVIKSVTRPGERKAKPVLNNPDNLYEYLYKFVRNINIAADTDRSINNTVDNLIKHDITQWQKAAHIYDWVQKNIHYIGFEDSLGGFYPRQAPDVYRRKFGDCKDMSSLLVAMLRRAGIKAYFAWIGTNHLPYTFDETPVPTINNHMICAIKLDNSYIFVDGTHPMLPLGRNRSDLQGKQAMVSFDKKHYDIVKIPIEPAGKNFIKDSTYLKIISDKSVEGTVNMELSGDEAWYLSANLMYKRYEDRDEWIRYFTERGSNKYLVTKYDAHVDETGDKEGHVYTEFNLHDYMQKIKGQYIINMNMDRYFDNAWIDTKGRTVPYYFTNKEKLVQIVVLEIPKGSRVAYLPHSTKGTLKNLLNYKITYKVSGNKVILKKEYELKGRMTSQQQFKDQNKIVSALQKTYKESVILTAK